MVLQLLAFLCIAGLRGAYAGNVECQPFGPLVPKPLNLASSNIFQDALANLTKTLDDAVVGALNAGWDINNVSMSLGIISLGQEDPSVPLWEFHHLAPGNVNGTTQVDRNSQYLVGSVSKVFSDLLLLKSGLNIDDPVTKYVPELDNSVSLIDWKTVTLRALASQLSGIPPNIGFSEYYYLKDYFESLGFPRLNDSDYWECGIVDLRDACTRDQFSQALLKLRPVAPTMARPVYSNIAFRLFVYALETQTGKNYSTLLQDLVTGPLNMPSTYPSPGDDTRGVVPPVYSVWGSSFGDDAPGGGLVSTLADLSALLYAIIDRTALDSPVRVREWIQPRTFTGSPTTFVGMPWEIFRPPPELIFPGYGSNSNASGHYFTMVTKDGTSWGYKTRIAILDEYGLGFVVLTAGDPDAVIKVQDAIVAVMVPAVDAAAREEALARGYAGSFAGTSLPDVDGIDVPVSVVTMLDDKSLRLVEVNRNGTNLFYGLWYSWFYSMGLVSGPLAETQKWRLYPAEVEERTTLPGGLEVIREDWRLQFKLDNTLGASDLPGNGSITAQQCSTDVPKSWQIYDWIEYGGQALDRIVFVLDAETRAVIGVDIPFLRTGLLRPGSLSSNETAQDKRPTTSEQDERPRRDLV